MKNLRNMFRFAKPETPGFGISSNFYITTFIPTTQLPTPSQVCNPTGEGGAEKAMIAPLDPGATKRALVEPLRPGNYAVASIDKKTVIELHIDGLSTTSYNPQAIADTEWAARNLSVEIRNILRATWHFAQFRFRSHHPDVAPALHLVYGVAARLAELTGGLVCDPLAQRYELGPRSRVSESLIPVEVMTFEVTPGRLVSRGMVKFALPEVSIRGFSDDKKIAASNAIQAATYQMLLGQSLGPGDRIRGDRHTFQVVLDPEVKPGASTILELIPDDVVSVDEALTDFDERGEGPDHP